MRYRLHPSRAKSLEEEEMSDQLPPIRRVVTGHDAKGTAKVLIDGPATNVRSSRPGSASTLMWSTDATPADIAIGEGIEDLGARVLGTAPPANGTRFTINDIPPGRPGLMHRTETLDYAIVLAGEVDMVMDDSTVTLKTGDVVIQRGTNHAWVNRGPAPARIAFVLLDATPLGIGNPRTRENPGAHSEGAGSGA
jgi:quercetin dioxygenase-like cupin family protein